ncbi:MAG TPA: efflux transporter periplasmic adaptor subunit, partial [Cytophagales bacterium]|nr:efflux transporter periplasmic adaptor subunit [Cytophagales bacterium]
MDKKIEKKRFTVKKVASYLGIATVVIFIAYQFIFADRRSKLKTDKDKITISEVKKGLFKEYIPQTGTVEPARTVYL